MSRLTDWNTALLDAAVSPSGSLVLAKNMTWISPGAASLPLTTKGDLLGYDTAANRIPVGTDGYVLTADAAEALGVKWAAPSGGGAPTSASYLVLGVDGTLTQERVLTAGAGISLTDAGAGSTLTVAATTPRAVTAVFDGGGADIAAGAECWVQVPFAGNVTRWSALGDAAGSVVVDVWKDTYANFPPTVADTIAGSEKPTLAAAASGQDTALTTWTTAVAAGDVLLFHVDSCTGVQRLTIILWVTPT